MCSTNWPDIESPFAQLRSDRHVCQIPGEAIELMHEDDVDLWSLMIPIAEKEFP